MQSKIKTACFQGFGIGSNLWLSNWSVDPLASTDTSVRNKYLAVYGVLGLFQVNKKSTKKSKLQKTLQFLLFYHWIVLI